MLEFDPVKDERNVRERGISLARYVDMRVETMLTRHDLRRDYGELRLRVFGRIDHRLHVAVITRRDERIRIISLRRANARERRLYEEETSAAR